MKMARQPDVRYIRLYTDGSAARKMELSAPATKARNHHRPKKQKKILVFIDPVAILGIMTAVVMLIVMFAGMNMLKNARNEAKQMEQYVVSLQEENRNLQAEYKAGYDLDTVEQTALALGMVPADQVEHISIHVEVPEETPQPDTWDQIYTFLTGLFA